MYVWPCLSFLLCIVWKRFLPIFTFLNTIIVVSCMSQVGTCKAIYFHVLLLWLPFCTICFTCFLNVYYINHLKLYAFVVFSYKTLLHIENRSSISLVVVKGDQMCVVLRMRPQNWDPVSRQIGHDNDSFLVKVLAQHTRYVLKINKWWIIS